MTTTQKYGFKVSVNQFHQPVPEDYQDTSEQILIDQFELIVQSLSSEDHPPYSMLELGSNQCYYSLLFKHILGKDKTISVMIEPHLDNLNVGKAEFAANDCDGIFYHASIGSEWVLKGTRLDTTEVTLNELIDHNNLTKFDVIQCDIDGSELIMLESNVQFFTDCRARYIFLATHSSELHSKCRDFFANLNYSLILDHPSMDVGHDSLLIYKSNA